MKLACVILTGGKSSRMGRPKESVMLADGRTMIEHVISALAPLEAPIHLSCSAAPSSYLRALGLPLILDSQPFAGPLLAILRALEEADADRILIVCCDQPLLRTGTLRSLVDGSIGDAPTFLSDEFGVRYDPFPCVVPRALTENLRRFIDGGGRSPRRWRSTFECRWIAIPAEVAKTLTSFNSESDLCKAEGI